MSNAIKVRRSGISRIFKKTPLRTWLDEQPQKDLTYTSEFKHSDKKGWTTEMFVREAWHRKMDVRIGTLLKWASGSQPRPFILNELRKEFPSIKF